MSTRDPDSPENDEGAPESDPSHSGSRGEFAVVGIAATLLTIALLGAINQTLAPHGSTRDLLIDAAWIVAFGVGLALIYLAWKVGGFRNLRRGPLRALYEILYDQFTLGAHGLGQVVLGLGTAAGVLVVISAVTNEPVPSEKAIAQFAIGAVLGGLTLNSFTRRHDVTIGARINHMNATMKELGREIDVSSKKLATADRTIREIDRDLGMKFRALANRRTVDDELTKITKANPELVKAIRGAHAGEQRRATWLQVAFVVLSFILGYVVNLTSEGAGELIQRLFG